MVLNNMTRTLGAGRFTLLNYDSTNNKLISVGEVPIGTERRRIVVSNFTSFLMSITYFGSASTPADNGTNTTNPTAVTPPGSMQAGDLVLMIAQSRDSTATLAISNAGGQSLDIGDSAKPDQLPDKAILVQVQWHMECQSKRFLR